MKFKFTKKLWISTATVVGISATVGGTCALVYQSGKDNRLAKFHGDVIQRNNDIVATTDVQVSKTQISIGNTIVPLDIHEYYEATNEEQYYNAGKAIDLKIQAVMKQYQNNPKLEITTPFLKFTNDYTDIFGWNDSLDFLHFFLNEVSWGPDVKNLTEFNVTRGIMESGAGFVLGSHSGTREGTAITFYPDSFFKGQWINGQVLAPNGQFEDSMAFEYSEDFVNNTLLPLKNKILSPDFENDKELDEKLFNKKTIDNFLLIFGDYLARFSLTEWANGDARWSSVHTPEGNFPNYDSFDTYVKSVDEIEKESDVKLSDGTSVHVYPKRFVRRLMLATFLPIKTNHGTGMELGDQGTSDTVAYNDFVRKTTNALRQSTPDDISSAYLWKPLTITDITSKGLMPQYYPLKQGNIDPNQIYYEDLINTDNDFPLYTLPSLYGENPSSGGKLLSGFSTALPVDTINKIVSIIHDHWDWKPYKISITAQKGLDNKNMYAIFYERQLGLIKFMEDYKKEHGWAPVKFTDQNTVDVGSMIPNLYLWKYFDKQYGLSDYYGSNFKFGPITNKHNQLSKTKFNNIGLSWLKFVTTHEYGHHQTIYRFKDLSTTSRINPQSGKIEFPSQIYASATYGNRDYDNFYDRNFINAFLRTRSGIETSGNNMGSGVMGDAYLDATFQIAPDATKSQPYFIFLDRNGRTLDVQGNPGNLEDPNFQRLDNPPSTYKDYGAPETWRGFKSPVQIASKIPVSKSDADILFGIGEPLSLPLAAMLANAIDADTYSVNPSFTGISYIFNNFQGSSNVNYNLPTAGEQVDPNKQHSQIFMGWNEWRGSGDEAIGLKSSNDTFELSGPYNVQKYDTDGNPVDGPRGQNPPITFPKGIANILIGNTRFVNAAAASMFQPFATVDDLFGSDISFDNANILTKAIFAGSTKMDEALSFSPSDTFFDTTGNLKGADFRYAKILGLNLKYDKVNNHYLKSDETDFANAETVSKLVGSGVYTISPTGQIQYTPILLSFLDEFYLENKSKGGNNWHSSQDMWVWNQDSVNTAKLKTAFYDYIVENLNKTSLQKVLVNRGLRTTADASNEFVAWSRNMAGNLSKSEFENQSFILPMVQESFNAYWKEFGSNIDPTTAFTPSSLLILYFAANSQSRPLAEAYALYRQTGAYPYFGDKFSDYTMNMEETLTRDFNQLQYVPDQSPFLPITEDANGKYILKKDQHSQLELDPNLKEYTEAALGTSFMLPPIVVRLWSEDFSVFELLEDTGNYDLDHQKINYANVENGWLEDGAIRSSLDGELYRKINDHAIDESKRHVYNENKQIISGEHVPGWDAGLPTNPQNHNEENWGRAIARSGKAWIRFWEKEMGIDEEKDITQFNYDNKTGLAHFEGYIPSSYKSLGYDHIAFIDGDKTTYIGIGTGYANNHFYYYYGNPNSRVSMLEYNFDAEGNLYKRADPQMGWVSDSFVLTGFSNNLLQEDTKYEIRFTKGESLNDSKTMKMGSYSMTDYDTATHSMFFNDQPQTLICSNGMDLMSAVALIESNAQDREHTYFTIRRYL